MVRGISKETSLNLDIQVAENLVTPKLPALLTYQDSLEPPLPPQGSFDVAAAARGKIILRVKQPVPAAILVKHLQTQLLRCSMHLKQAVTHYMQQEMLPENIELHH